MKPIPPEYLKDDDELLEELIFRLADDYKYLGAVLVGIFFLFVIVYTAWRMRLF
jgi:hypothetical protein